MWRDKIQIYQKAGKPVSKTHQDEQCQCGARSGIVDTQIFSLKNATTSICRNLSYSTQHAYKSTICSNNMIVTYI